MLRILAILPFLLATAVGCASYEYNLTEPADLACHIGEKQETVIPLEPLKYRMKTYDNHLVMLIENPTSEPIQLLGDQSTVVDPKGQSHPLRNQTIAPSSYIKLIFPPLRPYVDRWGPSIGFGVGYHAYRPFDSWDDPLPRYLYVADDNALYWDWDGEGHVRMTLAYQQGDKRFSNTFAFARVKM